MIRSLSCHTLGKNALGSNARKKTFRIYFLQLMVPEMRSAISNPSTLVIFLLYLRIQKRSDYLYDGAHSKFSAPSKRENSSFSLILVARFVWCNECNQGCIFVSMWVWKRKYTFNLTDFAKLLICYTIPFSLIKGKLTLVNTQ